MKNGSTEKEEFCAKCGTCNTVCPVFRTTGNEIHSPRGRQHLAGRLQKGQRSAHYADIFSKCLLCGACREVCPRGLDTPELVIDIRAELPKISGISFLKYLSRKALIHPGLFSGLTKAGAAAGSLLGDLLPEESGMRLRLAGFAGDLLTVPSESFIARVKTTAASGDVAPDSDQARVNYFAGCLANFLEPEIAESTQRLLLKTTGSVAKVAVTQTCCGMAAIGAGRRNEALELARRNIRAFEDNDLPILTSCSSCYSQLLGYRDLFADEPQWRERAVRFTGRLREFSTFFLEKFSGNLPGAASNNILPGRKVTYHDPCHLRFKLHITREPRQLLGLFPGIELAEFPDGPQCCGHGGLFQVAHPDLSLRVWGRCAAGCGAAIMVTACSGCLLQWRLGLKIAGKQTRAEHLATFLAGLMQ